jgi:hypothetical protein
VAQFLEEATGESAAAAEAIAHHWEQAGDADRAVHHLVAAAEDAGRGWAKEHAVALYREAIELVPEDDVRKRDLGRRLAVALQAAYHLGDVEQLRRS